MLNEFSRLTEAINKTLGSHVESLKAIRLALEIADRDRAKVTTVPMAHAGEIERAFAGLKNHERCSARDGDRETLGEGWAADARSAAGTDDESELIAEFCRTCAGGMPGV